MRLNLALRNAKVTNTAVKFSSLTATKQEPLQIRGKGTGYYGLKGTIRYLQHDGYSLAHTKS